MSADDIEKGTRWRSGIAAELEQSSIGIMCLTRENLDSAWIHFEAGALSKQQQNTSVCSFLFGLEPTDVREPLAQFQHTRAQKNDIRKLMFTINNALGNTKLSESELSEAFEVWWPQLEQRLSDVPSSDRKSSDPVRAEREIIEEILDLVRGLTRSVIGSDLRLKPKFGLASTANWDPLEAEVLFGIYLLTQIRLDQLKSADHVSERRVEQLEQFANRLKADGAFAREVFENLDVSSLLFLVP